MEAQNLPPFLPYTFHTKILGGDLWSPPSNKIYSPALDLVETRMVTCQEARRYQPVLIMIFMRTSWLLAATSGHGSEPEHLAAKCETQAHPRDATRHRGPGPDTGPGPRGVCTPPRPNVNFVALMAPPPEAGRHPSPCKERRSVSSIRREAIISRTTCENIRELFQVQMRHKRWISQ